MCKQRQTRHSVFSPPPHCRVLDPTTVLTVAHVPAASSPSTTNPQNIAYQSFQIDFNMSTAKLHPSLPAPVVHTSHLSTSHSKSHVLAGVQDAYWSDDETEDAECPLCLEEMDVSDLNFKPCPCGYQVCRFCWHHIKENLNRRCPACRREYTDDAVQFKPIAKEDHKRLTQQKKQRERERKELDALNRRHLLNMRVVQRNVVYVVGLGSRFAKEELIPTLRSNDYFGQYGKISKILLVKRSPPGGRAPIVGLYITYHRREDAARAIAAVDGSASPGGGQDVMRASHGTTKYCMAFLRNVSCTNNGCMDLHEWGDEKDCFTKEDLTTLKHTMKDTENRTRPNAFGKKQDDTDGQLWVDRIKNLVAELDTKGGGLPRAAGWASKSVALGNSSVSNNGGAASSSSHHNRDANYRTTRRGNRAARAGAGGNETRSQNSARQQQQERRGATHAKTPSQASSSRPSTPAGQPSHPQRPPTPAGNKGQKARRASPAPVPPRSPTSSIAVESDNGSASQDARSMSPSAFIQPTHARKPSVPSAPSSLPSEPPGLTAPPRIPSPTVSSPSIDRDPSSSSSYQMSTQARALLDDVRARRESLLTLSTTSPFPDFDRTLQNLSGGDNAFGGFNFNLDPNLATDDGEADTALPDLDATPSPFQSHFVDNTFNNVRPSQHPSSSFSPFMTPPPPGLSYPASNARPSFDHPAVATHALDRQSSAGSSYTGSFNPFAESNEEVSRSPVRRPSIDDDSSRRLSRFSFARERQGSAGISATSSPLHSADASLYSASENLPSASSSHTPWPFQRLQEFGPPPGIPLRTSTPSSLRNSPLVSHAMAQPVFSPPQSSRFQPFDSNAGDSLKDMIGVGRDRANSARVATSDQMHGLHAYPNQPFQDPAIMSLARYGTPAMSDNAFGTSGPKEDVHQVPFGPPPGLVAPRQAHLPTDGIPNLLSPGGPSNEVVGAPPLLSHAAVVPHVQMSVSVEASPAASPVLSASDFPALPPPSADTQPRSEQPPAPALASRSSSKSKDEANQVKTDKKAKKSAAAEKSAERERQAQERAAERERLAKEKAAEKLRIAKEKAEEKEKLAQKKALAQELAAREKAERDAKAAKEKADKEKAKAAKATTVAAAAAASAAVTAVGSKLKVQTNEGDGTADTKASSHTAPKPVKTTSKGSGTTNAVAEPSPHVPILSKMPKKIKPTTKPIKIPKEEDNTTTESHSNLASAVTTNSEANQMPFPRLPNVSEVAQADHSSGSHAIARSTVDNLSPTETTSLAELIEQIDILHYGMSIAKHPFFDLSKINPAAKMPLEYGPLVHALSALSVGGGSFGTNMPTGSIDNAVSSFQQLLETLTQTISDLLRLLPRTTWDDSSSFDGVLRDMLKGDDFLDEAGDDGNGRDDEVAALTLALERRARWMEVQLAKLEELHRDINTAAVRAVLAFNDRGWDAAGFLPRVGSTLSRFDHLGVVEENGESRPMTVDELEGRLAVAKEAVVFSETELREAMEDMQVNKPEFDD